MSREEWKQFEETKQMRYYVSTLGRVKSIHKTTNKEHIKKFENAGGYRRLKLNGHRYRIHRLVAQAFIPNPHNKPQVNHIVPIAHGGSDEVTNLEWCTSEENTQHATHLKLNNSHQQTIVIDYEGNILSEHKTIAHSYKQYNVCKIMISIINQYMKQYTPLKIIFINKDYYEVNKNKIKNIIKQTQ